MRHTLATLLVSAAFVSPAAAIGDMASFDRIQSECVTVGNISVGPQGRWTDCRLGKGRWFSTIGHIDFYQAQYCLGGSGENCEQRALLLFANRAYTPLATLTLGRLDSGDTIYADPQVLDTTHGKILVLEARGPERLPEFRYYHWQADSWQAIDTLSWRRELIRHLPPGVVVDGEIRPDFDQMKLQATLVRQRDWASGMADIELALVKARLAVKSVRLAFPAGR